jgi:hypothetical protein
MRFLTVVAAAVFVLSSAGLLFVGLTDHRLSSFALAGVVAATGAAWWTQRRRGPDARGVADRMILGPLLLTLVVAGPAVDKLEQWISTL